MWIKTIEKNKIKIYKKVITEWLFKYHFSFNGESEYSVRDKVKLS